MGKIFILFCLMVLVAEANAQDQMTNNGNLRLHPGATMAVFGDMANNGTYSDAGQMVTFAGAAGQTISGTAIMPFNRVTLANSTGLTLQQHMEITTGLTLTSGPLKLNSHTLTMQNVSSTAIARTSGYIVSEQSDNSGKIKWKINTDSISHVYPFGTTAGIYIPFTFSLRSGNMGYVTVSTYHTNASNLPYPVTPVLVSTMNNAAGVDNSSNVVDRFWQIDKDGVGGTAGLSFTATPAEVGAISGLKAQRWNSTTGGWDAPLPGQISTANTATVPLVSNFSPWTLSGNAINLPIELLEFTAKAVNNETVDLNWTTATETNNDYFTVERSIDGIYYEPVLDVDGAGNSSGMLHYKSTDDDPYDGVAYYRLKQTDMDGAFSFSQVEVVELTRAEEFSFSVFPNPFNGTNLNLRLRGEKGQQAQIDIYNVQGHQCYQQNLVLTEDLSTTAVNLNNKLMPGAYMVAVTMKSKRLCKRLIVQ